MKTVYVTDLDGTFFNSQSEISEFTKNTINSLIQEGMNFSFATARLGPSAIKLMSSININAPVFFMQGALTYNFISESFIDYNIIHPNILEITIDLFKKSDIPFFLFGILNGQLVIYYEVISIYLRNFYEEWSKSYNISFIKVHSIKQVLNKNIVYLFTVYNFDLLKSINDALLQKDVYSLAFFESNKELHSYNLGCLSKNTSKYQTVINLRNKYGYDKVVGFGDTTNDIPLLLACDEFYAPENADEQLKSMSNGIIESNDADGVAKFLINQFRRKNL